MKFAKIFLLFFVVFLVGCASQIQPAPEGEQQETEQAQAVGLGWKEIPLKDISSQQSFTISEFSDKPILIESFAVWCPTCTKQQAEVAALHDLVGEDVVSIALNTDPNENEARVQTHLDRHGFDWYYAISPRELTTQLVESYGTNIVNAPQAPMLLLCPGGEEHFLERGVKKASELEQTIQERCEA